MTDERYRGPVRPELVSLDVEDEEEFPGSMKEKRSRRNKHQTSLLRTSSNRRPRKADSLPIQKCRDAAPCRKNKKKMKEKSKSLEIDNKYTYDETSKGKDKNEKSIKDETEKDQVRGPPTAKFSSDQEESLMSEEKSSRKFEAKSPNLTSKVEIRGPPETNLKSELEVKGYPERNLTSEVEVKGPPERNLTPELKTRGPPEANLTSVDDVKGPPERNLTPELKTRGPPEANLTSVDDVKGPPERNLTPELKTRGPPEANLTSVDDVKGPPEANLTSVDDVKGPPERNLATEVELSRTSNRSIAFGVEKETMWWQDILDEKSNEVADNNQRDVNATTKNTKDERNSLTAKQIKMQVEMPNRTMKIQEQELNKFKLLNGGTEIEDKSGVGRESHEEKHDDDETEKRELRRKSYIVESKGEEGRLKQMNEDGVTCYYDNRLVEESEIEETESKLRLDPQYAEEKESSDRNSLSSMALLLHCRTLEEVDDPSTSLNAATVECRTSLEDEEVLCTSLVETPEILGTSQKEMTESSWTGPGIKEATENSFKSFDSGSCLSRTQENQTVNCGPSFRPELHWLESPEKPWVYLNQIETCKLFGIWPGKTLHHLNDVGKLKDIKDQINQIIPASLDSLKKGDNSKELAEKYVCEKEINADGNKVENFEDSEDNDLEEKYQNEETEKETTSYEDVERNSTSCEEMEIAALERDTDISELNNDKGDTASNDDDEGKTETDQLELSAVRDCCDEELENETMDDGDLGSLRIYSMPRQQEVEEMKRNLDLLDAKISEYSTELQRALNELSGFQTKLGFPGFWKPETSSIPMKYSRKKEKCVPVYGDLNSTPPNPPGRPRFHLATEIRDSFYLPERQRNCRRFEGFKGHYSGRNCSNSGGQGGSYSQNSSGSSKQESGQSGQDPNGNHSNDRGSKDKNNNGDDDDDGWSPNRPGPRSPQDATVPEYDPKRYRKKHEKMDSANWTEYLGFLKQKTENGPVWQNIDNDRVTSCIYRCLSRPDDLSDEMMTCLVCVSLNGLLKHYADCSSPYSTCSLCVQTFSLVCAHVTDCMNNNNQVEGDTCSIPLCQNIVRYMDGSEIGEHVKTLWFHVRKKLARIIGDSEADDPALDVTGLASVPMGPRPGSGRMSSIGRPSLPSIPETGVAPPTSGSGSNSRIISRKKSALGDVPEKAESLSDEEATEASAAAEDTASRRAALETMYSRGEITTSGPEGRTGEETSESKVSLDTSDNSGPIRGSRIHSLQPGMRGDYLPQNYYPSITDSPVGKQGIGEVVYGDRHRLVMVANYWLNLRAKYREQGKLLKQYREEGVILCEFKNLMIIRGMRYGSDFQWVKISPLGSGMLGKCHLASDFETGHHFCIKEIHISNYEKEEIELWSELDHPNIVKIFGAIRYRETIFILQEFIEGGSLTEAITSQKLLGRRLSQVTALTYFKQLLHVLNYLKDKGILHEDLKADNILLKQHQGSVCIKLTDFGLAQRCPDRMREGTTPVGTQTQWSPEKSESVGYGFPAELWAVVCVLVHMLTGYPPWLRRFENIKSLIVVIVQKSPPLEDIPLNIDDRVRDLIERGFTVCQNTRPLASDLLKHQAFRLLEETNNGKTVSILYSNLPSFGQQSLNKLEETPNQDLQDILEHLDNEKKSPAIPEPPSTYTVYTVHNSPPDGAENENGDSSPERAGTLEMLGAIETEFGGAGGVAVDPQVVDQYLSDQPPRVLPPQPRQLMILYDPEHESDEETNTITTTPTEITIMKEILPNFELLESGDERDDDDDDIEQESKDWFKDFDLDKALPKVLSNLSLNVSSEGSESPVVTKKEDTTDNSVTIHDEQYQEIPVVRKKEDISDNSVTIHDEQYRSIDDDDLFRSGPGEETMAGSGLNPRDTTTFARNNNAHSGLVEAVPNSNTTNSPADDNLDLSPYLVRSDNDLQHSTPVRGSQQNVTSPGIEPREAKMIKLDNFDSQTDPMCTPDRRSVRLRRSGLTQPASLHLTGSTQLPIGSHGGNHRSTRNRKEQVDYLNQQRKFNTTRNSPLFFVSPPSSGVRTPLQPLDVRKAQQGAVTPSPRAQTAPVVSPPSIHVNLHRASSERASRSPPNKTPSTTSTSQYEQQERAFKEIQEEGLSQHSEGSFLLFSDDDDDPNGGAHGELDFDPDNPAESIARYLAQSPSDSIKVTIRNTHIGVEEKVKFSCSKTNSWEKILETLGEEFGRLPELLGTFDRVYLTHADGSAIDLQDVLGGADVAVLVEEATGEERWWIENGVLMTS